MVYDFTVDVVKGNPNIDNIPVFGKKQKSFLGLIRHLLKVRREKYDIVIDFYSKTESWLTVLFSGAKKKISQYRKGFGWIYTDMIELKGSDTITHRLSMLNPLNLNIELDKKLYIYLSKNEIEWGRKAFSKAGLDIDNETVIFLNVAGSISIKTYPIEYTSFLIDHIFEKNNLRILFNYTPSQKSIAQKIFDKCSSNTQTQIILTTEGDSLREAIIKVSLCSMMIGNEGGMTNIAKALDVPTFSIFSPVVGWGHFDDGKTHISVHLEDYYAHLQGDVIDLYMQFNPELFMNEINKFIEYNTRKNENISSYYNL